MALQAGRAGDAHALPQLSQWLSDPAAGDTAAWALGRIEGGTPALLDCLAARCPAAAAAARALSGTVASQKPAVDALTAALDGPAAREAGFSLGVLARDKELRFPPATYQALAVALRDPQARAGATYALMRMPKGEGVQDALAAALRDPDPWTRSLAARAWGKQGLPAADLAASFRDPDWRVRVEAARGLAKAAGGAAVLREVFGGESSPHVIVALTEAAATLGELLPDSQGGYETVRCAVAMSRDRVRKRLEDTPRCAPPGWRSRARDGALAAELGLPEARAAFVDPDGRVRGAVAGAAGAPFTAELRALLGDADPYVVAEAAGALAKLPKDPATHDAALAAVQRLAPAHERGAGDPQSDALTALVQLTGPLPQLLPTPNVPLALELGQRDVVPPIPAEARAMPQARVLRIETHRGDMVIDLRPDVAPLTSSALAALARRGFYNRLTFHRVVPDFVVQGGDPRGDGDGGPGWALPDEHSPLRFERGTLGIATNGPNTGSSQFFLCHSPQPHLDGRYTVAGQLRTGDDVLDSLQPDDKILAVIETE